jgi:hypothetical protein
MNMAARIMSYVVTRKMPVMVVGMVPMMMGAMPQMMMRSSRLSTICEREKNTNHDKESQHTHAL